MTTEKQQKANQQNALLGGVKTEEGKAVTRLNAIKHGLTSNLLSKLDDDVNFSEILATLKQELNPASFLEEVIIERIAINFVRMARATKIEKNLIESTVNPPSMIKNYKDKKAGQKYKYESKAYDYKIDKLQQEHAFSDILLIDGPKPPKPEEPEYELIDNHGEVVIFDENNLTKLAIVIERYYTTAENRFYKATRELKELRGGNIKND